MELPVQFRSVRLLTGPRRLRPRSHSMITSKPYRAQRWAFRMGRQHNVVRTFLLLVFDLGQISWDLRTSRRRQRDHPIQCEIVCSDTLQ
jgi:hypothetical protein